MSRADTKHESGSNDQASSSSAFRCGDCIACFRETDCEKCPNCLKKIQPCLRRICVQAGLIGVANANNETSTSTGSDSLPKSERSVVQKKNGDESKKKYKKKEGKLSTVKKVKVTERASKVQQRNLAPSTAEVVIPKRKPHKPRMLLNYRSRTYSLDKPHVWRPKELRGIKKSDEIAQQCYGPNCAKAARPGSKYCSDDCGLLLADHRLKYILRNRVADFYRLQPVAEKIDDRKIRELTVKKAETESDLELAHSHAELFDLYIASLCEAEPIQMNQPQTSSRQTQSFSLFCQVCGSDFSASKFIRHIEKCSSDQDRKFIYGSIYSLNENLQDIICDQYDPNSQTYCKRLRFACAEHYNDLIGAEMKTCGYPLKWENSKSLRLQDMFLNLEELISDGVCMRPRNQCLEHRFWEQNIRALLDNHRMHLILYLDDLAAEYYHIFEAYRTRGDALTLLTNSRQLSREASMQEDVDYRADQMATAGFLIQKQEELSVENLYHTIRASRSAQTSTNSNQALTNKNRLLNTSVLLNSVNPADLVNLLPLLQKTIQSSTTLTNSIDSVNDFGEPSGLASLGPTTCFGHNDSSLENLVKIEQQL